MCKADGHVVKDSRGINTSSLELVDECQVMIGTHTSPAGTTDLTCRPAPGLIWTLVLSFVDDVDTEGGKTACKGVFQVERLAKTEA